MTLTQKLVGASAATLLILVLVAGIYQTTLSGSVDTYADIINHELGIKQQAMAVQATMLQCRRNEKDFLMRRDMKYVDRLAQSVAQTNDHLEQVAVLAGEIDKQNIVAEARALQGLMADYQQGFTAMADAWQIKGLDHKSGLQGDFRKVSHQLVEDIEHFGEAELHVDLLTIRKHEKDYLLRGDDKYIKKLHDTASKLAADVRATDDSPQHMHSVIEDINHYEDLFDAMVAQDVAIANQVKVLRKKVHQVEEALVEIVHHADELAAEAVVATDDRAHAKARFALGLVAFALVLTGGISYWLQRSIKAPLRQAADFAQGVADGNLDHRFKEYSRDEVGALTAALDQMADSLQTQQGEIKSNMESLESVLGEVAEVGQRVALGSNELADASGALSEGATEQAASLEEISASVTEISNQTQQNAESADQANEHMADAKDTIGRTSAVMTNMSGAMKEIDESSQEISNVNKVIDDIAFQTNLLALNAAVEAARAGRHGKGFAVVAEEVRNLAGRSAKAAREASELVDGSLEKVLNGSRYITELESSFADVVNSATTVSTIVGEIAQASKEQAAGLGQISEGLAQIDQVTQQNTANSEETAAAARDMSDQAQQLDEILVRFNGKSNQNAAAAEARPAVSDWDVTEADVAAFEMEVPV